MSPDAALYELALFFTVIITFLGGVLLALLRK